MQSISILIFVVWLLDVCVSHSYSECSAPIRNFRGEVDVEATLYNCTQNIRGAMFPSSYFRASPSGEYEPLLVNLTIPINTLIGVDDVNAQVTLDIYIRMYWKDPRLHLPDALWDEMNPINANYEGLEISPYIRAQNQLNIWLPDLQIMEAVSTSTEAELIHLFRDGGIYWSRHLVVTLTQAQMDLHQYPNDDQFVEITLQSFSYCSDHLLLAPFFGKGYSSLNTIVSRPGVSALSLNRLWTYNSYTALQIDAASGSFFHPNRRFNTVSVALSFTRQNFGIILRMVLPVAIFMMVVALTFWADIGKRIDITVQMLLVVSSLYFVIGQIIPFVGYFTTFDLFITIFFAILGVTIALHFFVYQLEDMKSKYPLALVLSEFLVYASRICALPVCMLVVYINFPDPQIYFEVPIIIIVVITVGFGLSNTWSFLQTCYFALCKLRYLKETRQFKHIMQCNQLEAEAAALKETLEKETSEVEKRIEKDAYRELEVKIERQKSLKKADGGISYALPALAMMRQKSQKENALHRNQSTSNEQHNHDPMVSISTQPMSTVPSLVSQDSSSATVNNDTTLSPDLPPQQIMLSNLVRMLSEPHREENVGEKSPRREDEALSDVDTIDTAVEHHQTREHKVGKMKADEDIFYDLLMNQDSIHKHKLENMMINFFQQYNCCDYHRQLRELMKEQQSERNAGNGSTSSQTTSLFAGVICCQTRRNASTPYASHPISQVEEQDIGRRDTIVDSTNVPAEDSVDHTLQSPSLLSIDANGYAEPSTHSR